MLDQSLSSLLSQPFTQTVLLRSILVAYGAALAAALLRPPLGRRMLGAGLLLHGATTLARGWMIGFFPLTNKMESFSTAALAIALVTWAAWRNVRLFVGLLLGLAGAALGAALRFSPALTYPPPLMQTLWYPLHVPLSFLAYGLWSAAAALAVVWWRDRDPERLAAIDQLALQGFAVWSVSMICGGVWGVVAWGAYFLWDAKVVWSVILWFHYAAFVHVRLAPALSTRPGVRPALAVLGFVWVLVAYVGTSFFFGGSSHSF